MKIEETIFARPSPNVTIMLVDGREFGVALYRRVGLTDLAILCNARQDWIAVTESYADFTSALCAVHMGKASTMIQLHEAVDVPASQN